MHEGIYSFDANDPGGETRFGISKRAFPNEDIKNLSIVRAKEIYRQYYWDACDCENLPSWARLTVFDCAVNQGLGRSVLFLQRVLQVKFDGVIGDITLKAASVADPFDFIADFTKLRLNAYTSNPKWVFFGKGWAKRLSDITSTSFRYLNRTPNVPMS